MKNNLLAFLLCTTLMGSAASVLAADEGVLYEEFSRLKSVPVHVSVPTDATGTTKVDLQAFKTQIEKSLSERKSIRFQSVDPTAAKIIVDTEVNGFVFSLEDPVDMLMGAGMAAMDAIKKEHYASMEATFSVKDATSGKVLWKEKLRGSVTEEAMTEEASYGKVFEKIASVFVREAFGKKKK